MSEQPSAAWEVFEVPPLDGANVTSSRVLRLYYSYTLSLSLSLSSFLKETHHLTQLRFYPLSQTLSSPSTSPKTSTSSSSDFLPATSDFICILQLLRPPVTLLAAPLLRGPTGKKEQEREKKQQQQLVHTSRMHLNRWDGHPERREERHRPPGGGKTLPASPLPSILGGFFFLSLSFSFSGVRSAPDAIKAGRRLCQGGLNADQRSAPHRRQRRISGQHVQWMLRESDVCERRWDRERAQAAVSKQQLWLQITLVLVDLTPPCSMLHYRGIESRILVIFFVLHSFTVYLSALLCVQLLVSLLCVSDLTLTTCELCHCKYLHVCNLCSVIYFRWVSCAVWRRKMF